MYIGSLFRQNNIFYYPPLLLVADTKYSYSIGPNSIIIITYNIHNIF